MLSYWKPFLTLALCCVGLMGMLSGRPIAHPAGVLVEREPLQRPSSAPAFQLGELRITPRAEYDIEARVLGVERYRFDEGAKLAPLDFAVGWGPCPIAPC